MAEPFLGQITLFAGPYPPIHYMDCDGRLLSINDYSALYSLLGNRYGGDGRTTFALPDLRGRLPMHFGQGPGLTSRNLGDRTGGEVAALSPDMLPSHGHALKGSSNSDGSTEPTGRVPGVSARNLYGSSAPDADMVADAIAVEGEGGPHYNLQPYCVLRFIIAVRGVYPSRS